MQLRASNAFVFFKSGGRESVNKINSPVSSACDPAVIPTMPEFGGYIFQNER